jgi:hypothetical protein
MIKLGEPDDLTNECASSIQSMRKYNGLKILVKNFRYRQRIGKVADNMIVQLEKVADNMKMRLEEDVVVVVEEASDRNAERL